VSEPYGDGKKDVASMSISGGPGPEVGGPYGVGEVGAAPLAISGGPSPEVGGSPTGGEEDAATIYISGKPGPEVGEPPPTWPSLFTPSFTHSGGPFLLSARGGGSSMKRRSSASEVPQTASPKHNNAVQNFRSRSKKTKIRRKKGGDAGISVRLWRALLRAPGI
jgi:hypothetical protein